MRWSTRASDGCSLPPTGRRRRQWQHPGLPGDQSRDSRHRIKAAIDYSITDAFKVAATRYFSAVSTCW